MQNQFISLGEDFKLSRSDGDCGQLLLRGKNNQSIISENGLNPHNITILDWNIYKGKKAGWQDDLLGLAMNSDIILLQESSNSQLMRDLLHNQGLYWNFNSAFKYRGVETGVLIASQIPPEESCGIREDEPIIGLPKTMLINLYTLQNRSQKLLVANVHGINITLGIGAYTQQFEKLHNLLIHHKGPMVVAGDFNNWNTQRKTVIDKFLENLSLTLLYLEDEKRTMFFGDPVDHILYRDLKPAFQTSTSVTSSDHNPITVTFRALNQ